MISLLLTLLMGCGEDEKDTASAEDSAELDSVE